MKSCITSMHANRGEANAWLFNSLLCDNDSRIAPGPIRAWRTGCGICHPRVCER